VAAVPRVRVGGSYEGAAVPYAGPALPRWPRDEQAAVSTVDTNAPWVFRGFPVTKHTPTRRSRVTHLGVNDSHQWAARDNLVLAPQGTRPCGFVRTPSREMRSASDLLRCLVDEASTTCTGRSRTSASYDACDACDGCDDC